MIKKFGKHSNSLINLKKSFFLENDFHVASQQKIASIYSKQEKRLQCKACGKKLIGTNDLIKLGVGYEICPNCSHLNGVFDDSNEYCMQVYSDSEGSDYSKNYQSNDISTFNSRISSIYLPKAEFLLSSLKEIGEVPELINYFDFGAGSGYFISALQRSGIEKISGSEVSLTQVRQGEKYLGKNILKHHEMEDTIHLLSTIKADVVSMIGVLEHLQEPLEALAALKKNPHVKYLYYSVPMFGLSVMIETLRDDIFHRHLQGGHTHLYTNESIEIMEQGFKFKPVSEWHFGSDMMDLYRFITVSLKKQDASEKLIKYAENIFAKTLDNIQFEIDKNQMGSETHRLVKVK